MGEPEPQVGDEVAWNWGSSHIEGEVAEKKTDKMTKKIKGKDITKNGESDNPAYFVKQTQKSGTVGLTSLTWFCFIGLQSIVRIPVCTNTHVVQR